jgi:hypothetical protein
VTADHAPIHADVFAAFGRDDADLVIAGPLGPGKQLAAGVPAIATRLAWLLTPLRATRPIRRRLQRGVHR